MTNSGVRDDIRNRFTEANTNRNSARSYLYSFTRILQKTHKRELKSVESLTKGPAIRQVCLYIRDPTIRVSRKSHLLNGYLKCLQILGIDLDQPQFRPFQTLRQKLKAYNSYVKEHPEVKNHTPPSKTFK